MAPKDTHVYSTPPERLAALETYMGNTRSDIRELSEKVSDLEDEVSKKFDQTNDDYMSILEKVHSLHVYTASMKNDLMVSMDSLIKASTIKKLDDDMNWYLNFLNKDKFKNYRKIAYFLFVALSGIVSYVEFIMKGKGLF